MSIIVALLQCRSSWWANCRPRWKTFSEAKNILFAHFHFFVIMLFSSLFHFILGIGCLQKNCQVVNGSGSSGTENFENKEGDLKETFLISPLLRKRWWWWWARQGSKGRLFVSPWFPLVRKCILGRTAPPSPPSIFFLKMLPSPHTKGFSPQMHWPWHWSKCRIYC